MQPRKITADYIFDGRRMLTGRMLLTDRDGRVVDLLPLDPGEDVEQHEGILSPGFINCHCHLELSHMKGMIPERTGLADFVFRVVTERHHAEEEITAAIDQAEEEMIRNGIVAVGDICNNILTRPAKQHNRLRYYNFIEASGWLPAVADKRFEHSRRIFDVFSENGTSKHNAIVPHAPYSVSDTLWDRIRPFFRDRVVTIHNQETKYENDFFRDGSGHFNELYRRMGIDNTHHVPTGRTSLQSFFEKLRGASRAILVHNTFTTREDVIATRQAAQNDNNGDGKSPEKFFCLCVNANRYIEQVMPPVDLLREEQVQIVLGTDSLASNHALSICEEMKTIHQAFPHVPVAELFRWATVNGARALQMDDLGTFEAGKRPGVILVAPDLSSVRKIIGAGGNK